MAAEDAPKIQINLATSNASFAVRFTAATSALTFPNVAGLPAVGTLTLGVEVGGAVGSAIAVHLVGSIHRPPLAQCIVNSSSATTIVCPFEHPDVKGGSSRDGLVFLYEPAQGVTPARALDLDWWSLQSSRTTPEAARWDKIRSVNSKFA